MLPISRSTLSFYLFLAAFIDLEIEGYCENRGCTDELS